MPENPVGEKGQVETVDSRKRGRSSPASPKDDSLYESGSTVSLPRSIGAEVPARGSSSSGSSPSPSHPGDALRKNLPAVGELVHHYELIREIDRGGMGVVFLARDLKLARLVALKLIRTEGEGRTDRFFLEAKATARCHHENIVVIHDIDEYRGNLFMVLEYLQGRSLRQVMDKQPMAPARAVQLMLPVARALARAHEHGIVHRDLKPENIVVTDAGIIKVLDFGIAKLLSSDAGSDGSFPTPLPEIIDSMQVTSPGVLIGTPPYMSPEQRSAGQIDHRTDIWAAGIILYELLLGHHPLEPLSPARLQSIADLSLPIPGPATLGLDAGGLGSIIERSLIKDAGDRMASAAELVRELEALLPQQHNLVLSGDDAPFAGLAAFQESDADRFFGRESEIAAIVTRFSSQPLVTLVGPSGSGKSSLVRAGVIPTLKRSGEGWHSLIIRPGRNPLEALTSLLEPSCLPTSGTEQLGEPEGSEGLADGGHESDGPDALLARLRREPGYLGQELRAWAGRKRRRVVILVDQFEELYTLQTGVEERTAFIRCLEGIADDASSPLRVILAIRSDFLDRVVEDHRFMTEVTRGLVMLPPIGHDGLVQALTRPVEAAGYRFESAELVERMLDALPATSGALPLLQFAASKLWEGRDRERRLLTLESYDGFGGVAGTLAAHADSVIAGMLPGHVRLARAIFERLVTPERTRAITSLGELCQLPGEPGAIEQVVHHLASARLLSIHIGSETESTRDARDADNGGTVELIHESLIASWPTLKRWLDDNQGDAEFLARLRTAAAQWESGERREGLLWRGEPVRQARLWHGRYRGTLPDRESRYLAAVLSLSDRAARIKRAIIAGTMVLLAGMAVAALVALLSIRDAEREATQHATFAQQSLLDLEQKEEELQLLLRQEQQNRQQAEAAKKQAENARQQAERAKKQAENARQEALEAQRESEEARVKEANARKLAVAESQRVRQALARARAAKADALAAKKRAEEAARIAQRSQQELEERSQRAQGKLKKTLNR